jgi:hypothetical protein
MLIFINMSIEKICKHCNEVIIVEKVQQFAHHVSRCLSNPNLNETLRKTKEAIRTRAVILNLECKKCKAPYSINTKPYMVKNNKYKKFCSLSCANSHKKVNKGQTYNCIHCHKECNLSSNQQNKFCSNKCQGEYIFLNETLKRYERGEVSERKVLRKILTYYNGYSCNECKIINWNNKSITLQVDHIDGNASNNILTNIRLLCPNCHTQTDTFSGRNKGNGSKSRGLSRSA